MKTILPFALLLSFSLLLASEIELSNFKKSNTNSSEYNHSIINVSNFSSYIINNGIGSNNPHNGDPGNFYPKVTANVVYSDGLVWGGYVVGDPDYSKPALRVGGQIYYSSTAPGFIEDGTPISPSDPKARIYRIRTNWQSLTEEELKQEAVDIFGIEPDSVTTAHINKIVDNYADDWQNWPVDIGAPFVDQNDNGKWDGSDIDKPGLPYYDQVIYFVMNDFDESLTNKFLGSPPLGLEIHVLIYAFDDTNFTCGQSYIKHYRIINKSAFTIDSLYLGHFADTDIGTSYDDFCGCNVEYNIAYGYNAQQNDSKFDSFGLPPSAVGYKLLLGPIVSSPGDTALLNYQSVPDYKNLSMTTFNFQSPGSPKTFPFPGQSDYNGSLVWYNILKGYMPTSDIENPTSQVYGSGPNQSKPTKLPLNGDPFLGFGDLDGAGNNLNQGERSIILASGPCTLKPGDSQEFTIAVVGGNLVNNLMSVVDMIDNNKDLIGGPLNVSFDPTITSINDENNLTQLPKSIQLKQNYPNPFNPSTAISYQLSEVNTVELAVYNVLGQKVATLVNGRQEAGAYSIFFNAEGLSSGIYYYKLDTDGDKMQIKKMILLK